MDLRKFFGDDRYAQLSAVELVEADDGHALATMLVGDDHLNASGFCQGGAIYTLADFAAAAAMASCGQLGVTLTATFSYLRPVERGVVTAIAHVVHNHRRVPQVKVEVYDAKKRLMAVMEVTGYRKGE